MEIKCTGEFAYGTDHSELSLFQFYKMKLI